MIIRQYRAIVDSLKHLGNAKCRWLVPAVVGASRATNAKFMEHSAATSHLLGTGAAGLDLSRDA